MDEKHNWNSECCGTNKFDWNVNCSYKIDRYIRSWYSEKWIVKRRKYNVWWINGIK